MIGERQAQTWSDYYEILGVSSTADIEEIRQTYYDICRRYHPDKQSGEHLDPERLEFWNAIHAAWKCLSNETKRLLHDIQREGRVVSLEDSTKLSFLQKEQYRRDIDNLKVCYQKSCEQERKKAGVIVIKGLFGRLKRPETKNSNTENVNTLNTHSAGADHDSVSSKKLDKSQDMSNCESSEIIDVTVPLQCMVDNHRLILPSGVSKGDLCGFYNPVPLIEKDRRCLMYICYEFKGKLHEVTVSDQEPLWVPMKAHLIVNNEVSNGSIPSPSIGTEIAALIQSHAANGPRHPLLTSLGSNAGVQSPAIVVTNDEISDDVSSSGSNDDEGESVSSDQSGFLKNTDVSVSRKRVKSGRKTNTVRYVSLGLALAIGGACVAAALVSRQARQSGRTQN